MIGEVGTVMAVLSKGKVQAFAFGGRADLGMDNPYVLVSSQGLVVAGQSSEELFHEIMIQSNISVVKPEDYRSIRMLRPSFGIENVQEVVAGIKVRNDVGHI